MDKNEPLQVIYLQTLISSIGRKSFVNKKNVDDIKEKNLMT